MKNIYIIFLSFVASITLSACANQEQMIDFINHCKLGSKATHDHVLEGLDYFESRDYVSASLIFDHVLDQEIIQASQIDIGTALWGSLLCAAILDNSALFEKRFSQSYEFFIQHHDDKIASNKVEPNNYVMHVSSKEWKSRPNNEKKADPEVKFANPFEKITIGDCIDRVKGVATALKFGIAFVKQGHYAFILNAFVDTLQDKCITCCRSGEFWTNCVSPILLKLNKWKLLGIPDDPAWD
jgi:hypothetical protein